MSSTVKQDRQQAEILRIVNDLKDKAGALIPILHGIQDSMGYVPPEAVPIIAHELNLTRAEVHGVVTFYHDFRSEAPGRHVVRVCQAESCQALGGVALTEYVKKRLGVDFHGTTTDRSVTLEPVYCLGNCACSPAVMVDGDVFGRVTVDRFEEILKESEAKG
ncbi:MAG TPA: formate dehydrogenase subunit gamma [Terriglobia bacterium]|nr:formate dehydrogenase subunit gamma [Terriglobia bacterium]